MDRTILLITVGIIVEIIIIAVLLKKYQNKKFIKFRVLVAILATLMASIQIFGLIMMLDVAGVFEPYSQFATESSIQNASSQALIPMLTKQDFPENWEWISETIQQPSKFPWNDPASDTAESALIAKVPHFLIFRHYVRIFHWSAVYDAPISEEDFGNWIVRADTDETSFVPNVSKAGKYFYAMCSKGSDFYACHVSVGYENHISDISVITPQELGEEFTIDLLDSSIERIEQRVK